MQTLQWAIPICMRKELSNDRAFSSVIEWHASAIVHVAIRGNSIQPAAAFCHDLLRVDGHDVRS
jgi:hypothetical protein